MLAAMIDGLAESGASEGAGAAGVRRDESERGRRRRQERRQPGLGHVHRRDVLGRRRACCCRCPARASATPRSRRWPTTSSSSGSTGVWAGMAITEPGTGSDSANIQTTAVLDGDEYVINGEKIYVTSGDRADHIVVWATLDRELGRAAIKSFVVAEGHARACGSTGSSTSSASGPPTPRRSSSRTAACRRRTSSASPEIDPKQGFAGAMATFDNTRPLVAAMAVGCATRRARPDPRAARGGRRRGRLRPAGAHPVGRGGEVPPDGGRPRGRPAADAAGRLDGRQPAAQLARGVDGQGEGRPGRLRHHAVSCVELCGSVGYSENELLEKWARDSKILDIFEGTQQIQQLIVARRVLGLSSAELK